MKEYAKNKLLICFMAFISIMSYVVTDRNEEMKSEEKESNTILLNK